MRRRLLAVAVVGCVVVGSLLPAGGGTAPIPFWDKLLHVLAYAAVTGVLAVALDGDARRRALLAVGGALTLGVGVELAQGLTATRTPDPADAVANAVGAALAASVVLLRDRL